MLVKAKDLKIGQKVNPLAQSTSVEFEVRDIICLETFPKKYKIFLESYDGARSQDVFDKDHDFFVEDLEGSVSEPIDPKILVNVLVLLELNMKDRTTISQLTSITKSSTLKKFDLQKWLFLAKTFNCGDDWAIKMYQDSQKL